MSNTKRTTITIPESLYQEAERLMAAQHFTDFSGFIQHLIRAENERREARAMHIAEVHAQPAPRPAAPIKYKITRKAHDPPKRKAG